ncbi:hypothetical protein HY570_00075 [Candidatus Micrarchaeota archaeon]|nr:hypothetical protein [Candidatus Micrarchaeota archaeon]
MDKKPFEIINDIYDAFIDVEIRALRKISNDCITEYSIEHSYDLFLLSLISYSIAKLLEKPHYWKDKTRATLAGKADKALQRSIIFAKEKNQEGFTNSLNQVIQEMTQADVQDKRFVRDMFEKARVKAAARLYAQGISLGAASELTQIDKRDILEYAGKTMMFDKFGKTKKMKERLRDVRRIFK